MESWALNRDIKYFIFDIVNSRWSGTGDSKRDSIITEGENYYLRELKRAGFEQSLFDWHDEIIEKTVVFLNRPLRYSTQY